MNNYTHHHAALYHCSLAIAAVAMAITMNSCQDYEYGFTEEEIHATAVQREYVKEFQKEFPVIDPQHDWMCEPDTVYYNSTSLNTRAASQPTMSDADLTQPLIYTTSQVMSALEYMKEEADNRGKCAQSFEYVAFEDNTYDIYPVFWGRKFCDDNEVGIYWLDESGNKHDLEPFWTDRDNKIKVTFEDTHSYWMPNSTIPITYNPKGAYNNEDPYKDEHGSLVKNYSFPHYTLTVTAGTKWGLYLRTNKIQEKVKSYECKSCHTIYTSQPKNWQYYNNSYWGVCSNENCSSTNRNHTQFSYKDDYPRITWYSNANYNNGTKAAATFHYDGKTYCSFEDAPHECTNGKTGNCKCGYGHYDHDFNDIILYISPRPYETTYESIMYRVMCEDLGGTFDWDFNDVVYDVIYHEDEKLAKNATVSIVLQAVGGTLPVSLYYKNEQCIVNGVSDLHQIANGQQKDENGLYQPVNVGENNHNLANKVVKVIDLKQTRVLDMDIRDYVKDISIRVQQNPKENGTTTEVKFPEAPKDNSNAIPQCFMTSTKTDWADELQPITEKYSHFEGWVMQQGKNADWWKEGLGGTEENVVVQKE